MPELVRVRQIKTNTIIVHRRSGRSRVRSRYDIQFGHPGRWAVLCGQWITREVNTTTDIEKVTCMKCLKRMEG